MSNTVLERTVRQKRVQAHDSVPCESASQIISNLALSALRHTTTYQHHMHIFTAVTIAACALYTSIVAAESQPASWGYKTNDARMAGPNQWSTKYPECGGRHQSPIDIQTPTNTISEKRSLTFSGSCVDFNMTQSEESFTASVNGGTCAVAANGASYNMKQFHMHVPSEHALNGNHLDGEIHFVHINVEKSALLVTGVFLTAVKGQSDPWVISVLDAMDKVSTNVTVSTSFAPYADIVNKAADAQGVFNYAGSATTPACNEIVEWWVVKKPVSVSRVDLDRLQSHLRKLPITNDGKNARPVQPLNGRVVTALL